jgi:hypothetical protein
MEPVESRVRDNILALPTILQDIIDAKGCTVREHANIANTGKRYKKLNKPDVYLKNKPKVRDRKGTLVLRPCHPDLKPALDKFLSGNPSDRVFGQVSDAIDNAATLVTGSAARGDDPDAVGSDDDMSDDEVPDF